MRPPDTLSSNIHKTIYFSILFSARLPNTLRFLPDTLTRRIRSVGCRIRSVLRRIRSVCLPDTLSCLPDTLSCLPDTLSSRRIRSVGRIKNSAGYAQFKKNTKVNLPLQNGAHLSVCGMPDTLSSEDPGMWRPETGCPAQKLTSRLSPDLFPASIRIKMMRETHW